MINKLMSISQKLAKKSKKDPELLARMEVAAQGQFPKYLIVSSLRRSSQDLQLLNMNRGDAFHATRVPEHVLPPPDSAPTLFKGPASFNREFQEEKGVIITFEANESSDVIRKTLDNLTLHLDLADLPIIALKVDYDSGKARLVAHGKGRDYEAENLILSTIQQPEELDDDILVLICSDSRVHPPHTDKGLPMAIQTLGGYIPKFSGNQDETLQLNTYFEEWLDNLERDREILIVAHGNFEGEGPSCGAATASLNPSQVTNKILQPVIEELQHAAQQFENKPPTTPEERVKSLCLATRENLLTYPAIAAARTNGRLSIDELFMDTVTNILYPDESLHS